MSVDIVGDLVGPLSPCYDISHGLVENENIYRRNGGCGVIAEGKLYIWGGEGTEVQHVELESDEEEFATCESEGMEYVTILPPPRITDYPFDVFDVHQCTWSRQRTTGDAPLLGLGSSLNYHEETKSIYLFGGWKSGNFDSDVYQIVIDDWQWIKITVTGQIKPIGRYLTGTLIHENRLCTIGGAGLDIIQPPNTHPQDIGAKYEQMYFEGDGFGINNEYYEFDLTTKEWSVPLGTEVERPDPLSCICFVKFDASRAILFGGLYKEGRRNDTRIFDLEERMFSIPLIFSGPTPCGRSFTTFTPLIDPCTLQDGYGVRQKMLLLWGKRLANVLLTDSWILDMNFIDDQFSWTQVDINTFARAWHIAAPVYYRNSSECRIAIFGGNVHSDGFAGDRRNIGDVRLLLLGVPSLSALSARVIARSRCSNMSSILPPHPRTKTLLQRADATIANADLFLKTRTHC